MTSPTIRDFMDKILEAETFKYPNGEVYHTEYDAPEEGSRVREKSTGREGIMVGHEPSNHGDEYSPDVYVAFDDDQDEGEEQSVSHLTLDDIEPVVMEDEPTPSGKKYPELHEVAARLADEICAKINAEAKRVESAMPYKAQFILEEMIVILQDRV
jgi:hypothetical protein